MVVDPDKMPEAEVSVRLAIRLIEAGYAQSNVSVAIDGAQVKTGDTVHFPLQDFLQHNGWIRQGAGSGWCGIFKKAGFEQSIHIHSSPGEGDVVAKLVSGSTLRAESKKGPVKRSRSSQEYPLIREAIGQLLTVEHANEYDLLVVAVPYSEKFDALATAWRDRPLMQHAGIYIALIDRENNILGLEHQGIQ